MIFFIKTPLIKRGVFFNIILSFNFNDFFLVVRTASLANSVRKHKSAAAAALYKRRSAHLPISSTRIPASLRTFILWTDWHREHLLINTYKLYSKGFHSYKNPRINNNSRTLLLYSYSAGLSRILFYNLYINFFYLSPDFLYFSLNFFKPKVKSINSKRIYINSKISFF